MDLHNILHESLDFVVQKHNLEHNDYMLNALCRGAQEISFAIDEGASSTHLLDMKDSITSIRRVAPATLYVTELIDLMNGL